jgi:hypothetical protein
VEAKEKDEWQYWQADLLMAQGRKEEAEEILRGGFAVHHHRIAPARLLRGEIGTHHAPHHRLFQMA